MYNRGMSQTATTGYYQQQVSKLLKEKSDFFFLGLCAIILIAGTFYMSFTQKKTTVAQTPKINTAYMASKPTSAPTYYIVKEGESLSSIAQDQLGNGDRWPEIVKINNITDINTVTAGTKLIMPSGTPLTALPSPTAVPSITSAPSITPAPSATVIPSHTNVPGVGDIGDSGAMTKKANPNIKEYTVQEGEGLWEIAEKVYGDGEMYNQIMKANKIDNPDQIYPGMKLKMPHHK